METCVDDTNCIAALLFKSYYVVWKLIDIDAVGERYEV